MNDEPSRLDPALVEALRGAAEYARYLGSSSVGTEHILLGFLRTGNAVFRGVANTVLRERILAKVERGTPIDPSRELAFAATVAKALGLPSAGTGPVSSSRPPTAGEVLVATLNESESLAGIILRSVGVTSPDQINLNDNTGFT